MQFIMFTKHLQDYDLPRLVKALKSIGLDGADLTVRPGYPVTPENCRKMLPEAVKAFAGEGLTVPLVTMPGDFKDPTAKAAEEVFAACGENGVKLIKLGYWVMDAAGDYWKMAADVKKALEGFAKLGRKHGAKPVIHTHSGAYMFLNASAAHHLIHDMDPKEIGVFLDTGHLSMCGEPMYMAISIVKPYVSCFAFKDLHRLPVKTDSPEAYVCETRKLGWGEVNWKTVCKSILDAHLEQLPISLHSEYNLPADSVADMTRIDLRFIKKVFTDLGVK